MKRSCIILSSRYLEHKTGLGHTESPQRIKVIMNSLRDRNLLKRKCCLVEPSYATSNEIKLVHEKTKITGKMNDEMGYITDKELLEGVVNNGKIEFKLEVDTPMGSAVMECSGTIIENKMNIAFSIEDLGYTGTMELVKKK